MLVTCTFQNVCAPTNYSQKRVGRARVQVTKVMSIWGQVGRGVDCCLTVFGFLILLSQKSHKAAYDTKYTNKDIGTTTITKQPKKMF